MTSQDSHNPTEQQYTGKPIDHLEVNEFMRGRGAIWNDETNMWSLNQSQAAELYQLSSKRLLGLEKAKAMKVLQDNGYSLRAIGRQYGLEPQSVKHYLGKLS